MELLSPLILLAYQLPFAAPARILAVHSYPAYSHETFLNSIWKELSLRGHKVTAVTTRPINDPSLVNLTEIDASFIHDRLKETDPVESVINMPLAIQKAYLLKEVASVYLQMLFEKEEVAELLKVADFDLLILEAIHPLIFAFGARYNVPIITATSLRMFLEIHDIHGNPTHPIAWPDPFTEKQHPGEYRLTFLDKVCSFLYNLSYRMLHYWYTLPKSDKIARKYFGEEMLYLGDIMKNNTVLSIVNSNPIVNEVRANVP